MKLTVAVAALVIAGLLGIVCAMLVMPSGSAFHAAVERDANSLLLTIPDRISRASLASKSETAANSIHLSLIRLASVSRHDPRRALRASYLRAYMGLAILPIAGTAALLGMLAGLLRRRFLMESLGYHSSTFSYLGKVLFAGAAMGYIFTSLSPLAPPLWTLYGFSLTAAIGVALYFRNLPPRL